MQIDLSAIRFKDGLIPAIIQDASNQEVLMLAYMSPESLALSLATGETHFWSRSRKRLWRKGETSGHIQKIKSIRIDCDEDSLLIAVEQIQVACHTGARSCFFRSLDAEGLILKDPEKITPEIQALEEPPLQALSELIAKRRKAPSSTSYTSQLLEAGMDRILKKCGEEATEFIISAKNDNKAEIIHEAADLLYHVLVALGAHEIPFKSVEAELALRSAQSGLAEKASRKSRTQEVKKP